MTSKSMIARVVPRSAAGERLDKWLAGVISELSRSRLKALIELGAVSVGGKVERDPAHRLKAERLVEVKVPADRDATPLPQRMDLKIVYEDEYLIVVDKPAGLVVHPAVGNPDRTLVNALLAHCGESLRGIGGVRRPGIVHRIDKDTSGLIVAAKTAAAHAGLAAQFAAHSVERTYDALVWGIPKPATGKIVGAIGRSTHDRKKMAIVNRGGKNAETGYVTVSGFGKIASHIKCRLKTGRTHQIRVHMAGKGHALIGDRTYGGSHVRSVKALSDELGGAIRNFSRQALHATTLGFTHPATGKHLTFASELPEDIEKLRRLLAKH